MYSLVSAPVLGFDLIRRAGGHRVAAILRQALNLAPEDLSVLAAAFAQDETRAKAWVGLAEYGNGRTLHTLGTSRSDQGAGADLADVRILLDQLTVAPVGSLDGLLQCVRTDVLDWATDDDAIALVCDAVAACYAADGIDIADQRRLAGPWTTVSRRLPVGRTPDLGPGATDAAALLGRVRHLTSNDLAAVRRVSATGARGTDWSTAMHNATWAVHLSNRVRSAASAQFSLVETLHAAGMSAGDAAMGSWNLLSGALHALMVADLLDSDTSYRLVSPALEALGPGWLAVA
jgi:hypothetical protein